MNDIFSKINLTKLLSLYHIVRYGSATQASQILECPVDKVHNDIKSLEKTFKGPLLLRNQKKVVLTELGKKIAAFAKTVVENIEIIKDETEGTFPTNDLVIGATHGIAEFYLPKIIKKFLDITPDITFHILSGREYLDFTTSQCDVVIGPALNNRGDLAHVHLKEFQYSLFASPGYIEKHGTPQTINDFKSHKLLTFKGAPLVPESIYKDGQIVTETTFYGALLELTKLGVGISALTTPSPLEFIDFPKNLVRILPDLVVEKEDIFLIYPRFSTKYEMLSKLATIAQEVFKEDEP